jgi:Ni/Co efflux regulator RcnB
MKSRTIAIGGSIAALAFAAGPVTAVAAAKAQHRPAAESQLDRSRDATGVRHVDKSVDKSKDRADYSTDRRDF